MQAEQLRRRVEEVACGLPQFGERLPRRWLHCDQSLEQLATSALNFCSLAQVSVQLVFTSCDPVPVCVCLCLFVCQKSVFC